MSQPGEQQSSESQEQYYFSGINKPQTFHGMMVKATEWFGWNLFDRSAFAYQRAFEMAPDDLSRGVAKRGEAGCLDRLGSADRAIEIAACALDLHKRVNNDIDLTGRNVAKQREYSASLALVGRLSAKQVVKLDLDSRGNIGDKEYRRAWQATGDMQAAMDLLGIIEARTGKPEPYKRGQASRLAAVYELYPGRENRSREYSDLARARVPQTVVGSSSFAEYDQDTPAKIALRGQMLRGIHRWASTENHLRRRLALRMGLWVLS